MKPSNLIFVFPGQGSQKKGMGEGLFDQFPAITQTASEELGYSIKDLCLSDPQNQLNRTEFTQPALFTVNALTFYKAQKEGKNPDFLAGHSLGEYNALLAADAFDFRTGLKLVKRRGELMSQASGGGMAAVIGLSQDQILDVIRQSGFTKISIANLNAPQQTVLTGLKEEILGIQPHFEAAKARLYMPLNVSGAFHSPFMQPARDKFEEYLKGFTFNPPRIPVISNVEAIPYPADQVATLLGRQITSPVRWVETIQYLMKLPQPTFEETGPGNVLKGLIKQISV
jgi:trans-AT polyketide synthase/acyltransferase/oxidoreductase domain-containing protein